MTLHLRTTMLGLLLVLNLLPVAPTVAAPSNILLLISDDIGVDATPFYPLRPGLTRTLPPPPPSPNLAALARRGVLFTSAWGMPLCAPSRAAIFTGRYAFRTGMGNNPNSEGLPRLARGEVILPEPFVARPGLNYLLGAIGKWHVSDGVDDPNIYGWPYYAGILPNRAGLELYDAWKKDVNGSVTRSRVYATTDQVNEAIGLIRRAKSQDKRYFVQVAFNAAHNPYHVPPKALHSRDDLPPFRPGLASRPYFEAMAEALDTEIGRLLREVSLADTTVIYVGDNGTAKANLVAPYTASRGKGSLYESGIRVPLVIAGAGVVRPGRAVDGPVNTVDLFPTIMALAEIPLPGGVPLDGVSLLPHLADRVGPRRSWAYSEQFTSARSYQRAIRNATFKLIRRSGGGREFYNLAADPLEKRNLLKGSLTGTQRANLEQLQSQLDMLLASR